MAGTPRRERLLRNIEAELSLLECLVGHVAAEAALGSARGLTVDKRRLSTTMRACRQGAHATLTDGDP